MAGDAKVAALDRVAALGARCLLAFVAGGAREKNTVLFELSKRFIGVMGVM